MACFSFIEGWYNPMRLHSALDYKEIRDVLQWQAGTPLTVEQTADGVLLKRLTSTFAPARPEDVFACLRVAGAPKSTEEMAAGIAAEAKRRHARGRY